MAQSEGAKPKPCIPEDVGLWALAQRHLDGDTWLPSLGVIFCPLPRDVHHLQSSLSGQDNLAATRAFLPTTFNTRIVQGRSSRILTLTPFMTWLKNSWIVTLVASSLNVFIAALAAYAFSRFRFRGRRAGLLTLLLVQIFPQFLAFIAILLLMIEIGNVVPAAGLDTLIGLMLVYLGGAIGFNAFLIKGFMDTIPSSLDESARVDGASHGTIFWRNHPSALEACSRRHLHHQFHHIVWRVPSGENTPIEHRQFHICGRAPIVHDQRLHFALGIAVSCRGRRCRTDRPSYSSWPRKPSSPASPAAR